MGTENPMKLVEALKKICGSSVVWGWEEETGKEIFFFLWARD
jgi:hypothetical protein